MRKLVITSALVAMVVTPTLTACSLFDTSVSLDPKAVEVTVAQGIIDQTGVEPTVVCPEEMRGQVGETLTCTATDKDGNTATVSVVIANDKGDITWEVSQDASSGAPTTEPTPAP